MGWVPEDVGRVSPVRAGLLIFATAGYMPARIYAANLDKFPHPERVILIVLALWLLGCVLYVVVRQITTADWATLMGVASFVWLVGSGGSLASRIGTLGALMLITLLSVALGVLLARVGAGAERFIGITILALIVAGTMVAALTGIGRFDDGEMSVQNVETPVPTDLDSTPDVFVVVLDGFPGERAQEDVYGDRVLWPPQPEVKHHEAWADYPVTLGSLSALLEMGHPLADGAILDGGTRVELARRISGDNRFTRLLMAEGYEAIILESGWSRSNCHEVIDTCVASPFLDEGVFEILQQSIASEHVTNSYGSGMTVGALETMDWLRHNLPRLAVNNRPDFVFANVVLPHPPLFLNHACQFHFEVWRSGNSLYVDDEFKPLRRHAFLEQTRCVAQFEVEVLQAIPSGPLVIFLSDHGGDSNGQLSKLGHDWSEEDLLERMNVHLAVRSPIECDLKEPVFVSEVLWRYLWCMAGETSVSASESRMFIAERIAEPKILRLTEVKESPALRAFRSD